ncbi:hypothetical protein Rsub_06867 [Raphidocelis subcapitata]|uniref:Patatin n=1 Tax=Raphidocelis subcapitata TaxID=307507 RepID=A0A2V0P1W5_9CHLO|nr:hypothetical protein Rsub_06867 [Raphidocelis subcapitata]|eukprot:GBF93868.1 hypothetical protein Rsub_06867 [Raphidocelis subcapitata]
MSALAAAQAGNLGVGFSGAGFLIYFYFGVVDVLQRQLGVIKPDMPMAGASSGALILLTTTGIVPLDAMIHETDGLAAYCRGNGACMGTLEGRIRSLAEHVLPASIPLDRNAHVAVTIPARGGAGPQTRLVTNFSGRQDLIDAGVASCYIPYFAGSRLTTSFRGEQVYDGSFNGNGQGWLPCPPGVAHCVRVSSMPAGLRLGELLRSPLRLDQKADTIRAAAIAATALPNAAGATISMATTYAANNGALQDDTAAAGAFLSAMQQLVTPGEGEADVFPGRRHPLPTTDFIWASWLASAAEPAQNKAIFELGQKEAWSWAEENGFVPAGKTLAFGAPSSSSAAAPSLAPLPAVSAVIEAGAKAFNGHRLLLRK